MSYVSYIWQMIVFNTVYELFAIIRKTKLYKFIPVTISFDCFSMSSYFMDYNSMCPTANFIPNETVVCFSTLADNGKKVFPKYKREQDRSHQWSTRPAHSTGRQWLSLELEVLGRTDGRTLLCENNDHYRSGLWSASWINIFNCHILRVYCHFCRLFTVFSKHL